mmetsp:Transcript_13932/g.20345  ORF Transcript_13932/g.20345 Transcript_13932/m.20345 type:complete len:455 (+) Transcript_13932:302-1666(+)
MMSPSTPPFPFTNNNNNNTPNMQNETTTIITTNQETLEAIGNMLNNISNQIDDLEQRKTLGPTITRACEDLASTIAALATELDDSNEEKDGTGDNDGQISHGRRLARAISDDANAQLSSSSSAAVEGRGQSQSLSSPSEEAARAVSDLTEEQLIAAVSDARSILLDVECVLRSIGQEEADEIAEVALIVARMFIWALKDLHGVLTPPQLQNGFSSGTAAGCRNDGGDLEIEILDSDEEEEEENSNKESKDDEVPLHQQNRSLPQTTANTTTNNNNRMRVLWPPIGPAVASAGKWGAESAAKSPLLSIALSMTLWPAAMVTTFVGAPILATDYVLQKGYDAAFDTPFIANVEKGAANLFSVGKLYFLCGKLVLRQGWRVGERQIERRGGVGAVAQELGGMAVDRALHPIETVGMAWEGAKWGVGVLKDFGGFVRQVSSGQLHTPIGSDQPPMDMH